MTCPVTVTGLDPRSPDFRASGLLCFPSLGRKLSLALASSQPSIDAQRSFTPIYHALEVTDLTLKRNFKRQIFHEGIRLGEKGHYFAEAGLWDMFDL